MKPDSIVCPVDFSDPSRGALRYAAAIAGHFGARLLIVSIDDPLLDSAARSSGGSLEQETMRELERFVSDTVPKPTAAVRPFAVRVGVGKPAPEIVRIAQEAAADLIVMSSHGRTGLSKRFFGSTAERVLRETTVPVLVTPKQAESVASVSDIARQVQRVLAPADLTAASQHQVTVAGALAVALDVPLLVAHILEPVHVPTGLRMAIPVTDSDRRASVDAALRRLVAGSEAKASVELLVSAGDPSEEIVTIAETRHAGLIVMGLHSSGLIGPRMGSVTYRVLSLTRSLVLALPPTA
jgi:nucleotide-binding universal stress UspA family protein